MQQQEPATAVMCGNDVLAFRAILEAPRINVDISGQVSVVGFDDLVLLQHLKSSLTTIQIPTKLMWTRAADILSGILRGADMPRATEINVNLACARINYAAASIRRISIMTARCRLTFNHRARSCG